jgi:hypothetical protein
MQNDDGLVLAYERGPRGRHEPGRINRGDAILRQAAQDRIAVDRALFDPALHAGHSGDKGAKGDDHK